MRAFIGATVFTALVLPLGPAQACRAAQEGDSFTVVQQTPLNEFLDDVKLERPVEGKTNRPNYRISVTVAKDCLFVGDQVKGRPVELPPKPDSIYMVVAKVVAPDKSKGDMKISRIVFWINGKPCIKGLNYSKSITLNKDNVNTFEKGDLVRLLDDGTPEMVRKRGEAGADKLRREGYKLYPIRELRMTCAYPIVLDRKKKEHRKPDPAPWEQLVGEGGFDAVTNGSFTSGGHAPAVPLMLDGERVENTGDGVSWHRGGVWVLQDGTIRVARQRGASTAEVKSLGTTANPVRQFMGGGALLVEKGRPVSWEDLHDEQRQAFDAATESLDAGQFRPTYHALVGTSEGRAFLIISPSKATGHDLRADLHKAGFSAVVMFDGGRGFFGHAYDFDKRMGFDNKQPYPNSLGLCARVRR